jgi:hypothetical protein
MFIEDNSEEIPNSKEAMTMCMAYLWENVIEPSSQKGIIGLKNYDMIKEIGHALTIIGEKAHAYEKMIDNNGQLPYNRN